MELIINTVKLLKVNSDIKDGPTPKKTSEINFGINIDEFEINEDSTALVVISFTQQGLEGQKKKKEFFSITSQHKITLRPVKEKGEKKLDPSKINKMLVHKSYPLIRPLHILIMNQMGIMADLPWDLPPNIEMHIKDK